ncbi:MAG: hypothetical protein A3G13_01045 [Candidatus Levybacteria bacterium RIFCSPLOWO2_12_FULL_37_7]|nr:MAG: hypothetical protein A3G13_01045 [Candidatus Levybacteria bacterium RIFCSPLOWO2_12_FULL_37_7]
MKSHTERKNKPLKKKGFFIGMNNKNNIIVAKFGGTSVGSAKNIQTICSILLAQKENSQKHPVIVVSAVSGITDLLLFCIGTSKTVQEKNLRLIKTRHKEIIDALFFDKQLKKEAFDYIDSTLGTIKNLVKNTKVTKELSDKVISFGEIISSYLITKALQSRGVAAHQVLATDVIVTNNNFTYADFLVAQTEKNVKKVILPLIAKKIVPVVTGFIGKTVDGKVTTLGRGGSDYSASIIGYCLEAFEIQIWTDVNGVYSADPKIVKRAQILSTISYREASELAWFGAKVLHPRTIRPAVSKKIPVKVLNTFQPTKPGTLVLEKSHKFRTITAISCKKNIILVNIYSTEMLLSKGFLARIFEIFAKHNISIDLVSASEVSISVTLDNEERLQGVATELSKFTLVTVAKNLGIVSLVGEGIVTSSKTIKAIFEILDKKRILVKMVSLGATNVNVSVVVDNAQIEKSVKILHNELLLAGGKNGLKKQPQLKLNANSYKRKSFSSRFYIQALKQVRNMGAWL